MGGTGEMVTIKAGNANDQKKNEGNARAKVVGQVNPSPGCHQQPFYGEETRKTGG